MARESRKNKYIFSPQLANIRILNQNAVAMTSDGSAISISDLGFKMPLCILNQDEVNRASVQELRPFYQHVYTDSRRLEHRAQYDALTEKVELNSPAFEYKRECWFDTFYVGTEDIQAKNYVGLKPEKRDGFLRRLHEFDFKNVHMQKWFELARDYFAEQSIDAETDKKLDELRDDMRGALFKVNEDFLLLMNEYGVNFVCADSMAGIDGDKAYGISYPTNGIIKFARDCLDNSCDVAEEIIHYIDGMEGFTCQERWIKAAQAESAKPLTRAMMDVINETTGKASLFDKNQYSRVQIPMELLPDLHRADLMFDDVVETLRKRARGEFEKTETPEVTAAKELLKRAKGDKQFSTEHAEEIAQAKTLMRTVEKDIHFDHTKEIADAKSLLRLIDLKHNHCEKELVMSELFPQTWPMYKEFMAKVHEKAQVAGAKIGLSENWAEEIAQQPRNGVSLVQGGNA